MNKHLTIEDYEKYIENNTTDEYLVWLETIQEHMLGCDYCQSRLQKFLVADAISESFHARAFAGMGEYLQRQKEESAKTSLLDGIKQVLQQVSKPELWERAKESIESGLVKTLSFSRSSYPGMLCAVRGEAAVQEKTEQEAIHRIEWEDGKILVYVNATDKNTLYVVELKIMTSEGGYQQVKMALPGKTNVENELIATFACDSQNVRYEVTLVPIRI